MILTNPFNNYIDCNLKYNKETWEFIFANNNYKQTNISNNKSYWFKNKYPTIIISETELEIVKSKTFKITDVNNILKFYNLIAFKILKENENIKDLELTNIKDYVYLIGHSHLPFVKIGKTSNINKRLMELQTSSPYKLEVILLLKDKDKKLENYLHKTFSEYRLRGEWFDDIVINIIKDKYNNLIENIINE